MSWLDLPPLDGVQSSTVAAEQAQGPAKVLIGLVGAGLVALWTEYGMDVWQPREPAALAKVLGVEEVERVDMGAGFAEVGLIDPEHQMLVLRTRTPSSGAPRRFAVTPGTFPNENLDPFSVWQLKRMADLAVRRGGRWLLQPGGYGAPDLTIAFEVGMFQRQRRVIVTAAPPRVARTWDTGQLGRPSRMQPEGSRSAGFPVTSAGVEQAVGAMVAVMRESGLRSYELMPTFPTV